MTNHTYASPAVIEFARFVFLNPGASRSEILSHLWAKLIVIRIDQTVSLTRKEFNRNVGTHLFSPYFTSHLSNIDGSECNSSGKIMDWYRTPDGPHGQFRYWLTARGVRLLNAHPLRSKDLRVHAYRNNEDYNRVFKID